jgi:hypothetical protein
VALPVYRRFDHPPTWANRFLTRHAGFFPNDAHPVDRSVYIIVLSRDSSPLSAIVYHACHPVTRASGTEVSSDFIAAVRRAVMQRFSVSCCVFLQGCLGDIRPNIAERRVRWLPPNRLNWRFKPTPTAVDEWEVDAQYTEAVAGAVFEHEMRIEPSDIRVWERSMEFEGLGSLTVPQLAIGSVVHFSFAPFEVSHRYQLELSRTNASGPRHFICSCSGDTRGYLPHRSQLTSGGYEVDGSRDWMGLDRRVVLAEGESW